MSINAILPVPVVLLIVGAVAAPLLARVHRRLPLLVGIAVLLLAGGFLLVIAKHVFGGNGHIVTEFFSNERPVHGQALGIAFTADPFGMSFALLTVGVGVVLLLSTLSELGHLGPHELGGLAALMLLLMAALVAAALTADTVNLFVWLEVASLASFGLTGFFLEQPVALEAAFKVLVLTGIAAYVVFIGSAMLYREDGALNFGQLHQALARGRSAPELVALALILSGYATKAGLVPFHGWLPDAHATVPGAALFSALMVDLGVVGIVRFTLLIYGPQTPHVMALVTVMGITSALLGATMALAQDDLKRLLAWDTVSQTGILAVGFASRTADGVGGAVYHMVNHGLFKALLFLCAGSVLHATGLTKLSDMGGLVRRRPLLTAGFIVGALSIGGVPPFNGFASLGLIHHGLHHEPMVLILAMIAQVVTVAALARAAYLGFLRRRPEPYEHLEPLRAGMRVSLVALGAGCAAFGVLPGLFVRHVADPAAALLLSPSAYAEGALGAPVTLPRAAIQFSYTGAVDLITTSAEIVLGLALAVWVVRRGIPRPVNWLRAVHTGSVNDYALFLTVGIVVVSSVLVIR